MLMADNVCYDRFAVNAKQDRKVRASALVVVPILAVLALLAAPGRADAATCGHVTVKTLPADMTLSADDTAAVDLVISNGTAYPVRITTLHVRLPGQVAAEHVPSPAKIRPIPANSFVLLTFMLRALPGMEDGEADILLEVKRTCSGHGTRKQLITSSLSLKAGSAARLPDASFVSFPDSLNDGQSVRAALRISNPTPFTMRQVRVTAVNSTDVTLGRTTPVEPPFTPCHAMRGRKVRLLGCLATLAPGDTAVLYVATSASHRVQTGTQRVAVVVAGQTGTSREPVTSTVVATASVQVTIFGVDALSPFGLGTLFVLPGLLTVLTFLLLARYVYPRSKALPDTVQFKDPRTLLYVVPPAALIYLVVWEAWGVNLANQAGTADVALLFGLGVALGFTAWVVAALLYYNRSGRKQFRTDDSPEKVLQRLEARDALLVLPEVATGGRLYRYLADGPAGELVVCSPAKYEFAADADAAARRGFADAVDADDIAAVRGYVRRKKVSLRWLLPTGVTLLDRASGQFQPAAKLLTEEYPP